MYTIVGGLLVTIGSFGAGISLVIIMTNTSYTWTAPLTGFESGIIALLILSFMAIVAGICTFVFGYIKAKNQKSLNSLVNSSLNSEVEKSKCPNCGINISATCTKCPSCGTVRKID